MIKAQAIGWEQPAVLGACPSIERILLAKDERVGFHLPHEQDIPRLED